MFVTGTDFDTRHLAGPGHQVGVVAVRRACRLSRSVGDDFAHAKQAWTNPVAPYRGDMGIAFVARQNREKARAQHFGIGRRIRAVEPLRSAFQPARPQPRQGRKFDEVGQLPH